MTATEREELALAAVEPSEEVAEAETEHPKHAPLPWIGALANPRLGPMLGINDNGYLVPLWTAGDLLRGCRHFWRGTRERS